MSDIKIQRTPFDRGQTAVTKEPTRTADDNIEQLATSRVGGGTPTLEPDLTGSDYAAATASGPAADVGPSRATAEQTWSGPTAGSDYYAAAADPTLVGQRHYSGKEAGDIIQTYAGDAGDEPPDPCKSGKYQGSSSDPVVNLFECYAKEELKKKIGDPWYLNDVKLLDLWTDFRAETALTSKAALTWDGPNVNIEKAPSSGSPGWGGVAYAPCPYPNELQAWLFPTYTIEANVMLSKTIGFLEALAIATGAVGWLSTPFGPGVFAGVAGFTLYYNVHVVYTLGYTEMMNFVKKLAEAVPEEFNPFLIQLKLTLFYAMVAVVDKNRLPGTFKEKLPPPTWNPYWWYISSVLSPLAPSVYTSPGVWKKDLPSNWRLGVSAPLLGQPDYLAVFFAKRGNAPYLRKSYVKKKPLPTFFWADQRSSLPMNERNSDCVKWSEKEVLDKLHWPWPAELSPMESPAPPWSYYDVGIAKK